MYKGKRRRLRKKDLYEVNTFNWLTSANIIDAVLSIKGGKKRFFSRVIKDRIDIHGAFGDALDVNINMSLISDYGVRIVDDLTYILLPKVEGRKYYWVDEEQA